jgi:hypothetical protein
MRTRSFGIVAALGLALAGCGNKSDEDLCKQAAHNWFHLPKARVKCQPWEPACNHQDNDTQTEEDYVAKNCRGEPNRKLWNCMARATQKKDCFPESYE